MASQAAILGSGGAQLYVRDRQSNFVQSIGVLCLKFLCVPSLQRWASSMPTDGMSRKTTLPLCGGIIIVEQRMFLPMENSRIITNNVMEDG